jgi:hypothetical protein
VDRLLAVSENDDRARDVIAEAGEEEGDSDSAPDAG